MTTNIRSGLTLGLPRRLMVFALLWLASVTAPAQVKPGIELSGAWEGQLLLGSNWRFMEARFGGGGNPADAKVDLPQERREFRDFEVQGNRLQWTLVRGAGRIRFDATLSNDVIRGQAEQNGVRGEFQLVRIDRTSTAPESGLPATYRTGSGDLVTIARFDFGDGIDRLALMDTQEGYWGTLLPAGPDKYLFAPARSGRFPSDLEVEFSRAAGGAGTELTMTGPAARRVRASRIDAYDSRQVQFRNGDITLAGNVMRPRSRGLHPAVVMVHSSGNQSRNGPVGYFRLIANLLAANGITTLVYDKRGVGESTGSWPTATFEDLAGDLRAAVTAVRQETEVDPGAVGLWSLSQGGWIAPLLAAEDARIAFLALVSAAATTPAQQDIERVAMVMKANGSSERDIAAAERYLRIFFEVVTRRRPWEDLQSAMAGSAAENWLQYVPRPPTERDLGWTPALAAFDPVPVFRKVTVPVLALHGADDVDVRATTNSTLFATMSTHPGSRQHIFDDADHYMLSAPDDPDRDYRRLSRGYLQMMIDWINQVSRR